MTQIPGVPFAPEEYQTPPEPSPKFVQIAVTSPGCDGLGKQVTPAMLFALRDDGTVWYMDVYNTNTYLCGTWRQLPDIQKE